MGKTSVPREEIKEIADHYIDNEGIWKIREFPPFAPVARTSCQFIDISLAVVVHRALGVDSDILCYTDLLGQATAAEMVHTNQGHLHEKYNNIIDTLEKISFQFAYWLSARLARCIEYQKEVVLNIPEIDDLCNRVAACEVSPKERNLVLGKLFSRTLEFSHPTNIQKLRTRAISVVRALSGSFLISKPDIMKLADAEDIDLADPLAHRKLKNAIEILRQLEAAGE